MSSRSERLLRLVLRKFSEFCGAKVDNVGGGNRL